MRMERAGGHVRRLVIDGAAAVVLALLCAYATLDPPGPVFDGPAWLAVLLAAMGALSVAVRRVRPLAALAGTVVAAVVATVLGSVAAGLICLTYVPTALALYAVAVTVRPIWSGVATFGCLVAATAAVWHFYVSVLPGLPGDAARSELPISPAEVAVVWVVLYAAWTSGLLVHSVRVAAARQARQLAESAVATERLRIARELHDITGHSLSLIAVKAGVANHVADDQPAETREALRVIEATSRRAVRDVRRVLDLLRTEGEVESLDPPPGTAELTALADRMEREGVVVELDIRGDEALPEAAARSVYRIVQEALTNVLTHVGPTRCQLRVETGERDVRIDITDEGPSGPAPRATRANSTGYGLTGMRERVALFGGTLTAEPTTAGGFRVSARLPFEGDST